MWQDLFRRSDLITRFAQGPWGTHLDEFVSFLRQQHYALDTIRRAVVAAAHFADWLSAQQLSLPDASADSVARYLQSGCCPQRNRGLSLAVQFLKYKGIVLPHACTSLETPISRWLACFDQHLDHVVGAATSTRRQYQLTVERFLHERFSDVEPDWSQLCADDLSSFVQREAPKKSRHLSLKITNRASRVRAEFVNCAQRRRQRRKASPVTPPRVSPFLVRSSFCR
jgi:hypothetical protein